MYPLVVILGLAALRRDRSGAVYAVALALIGAVIAAYHVVLEWFPSLDGGACDPDNPCTLRVVPRLRVHQPADPGPVRLPADRDRCSSIRLVATDDPSRRRMSPKTQSSRDVPPEAARARDRAASGDRWLLPAIGRRP